MKRINSFLWLTLALALILSLLCGCSSSGGDKTPVPDNPTSIVDDADIDYDYMAERNAFIGKCFEPEDTDVILEFSLDDLIELKDGIICFPGLDWDTEAKDLASHFGVSKVPAIEDVNPELWVKFTVGNESFYAVPYISNFSQTMSDIKQFNIQVNDELTGEAYMDSERMDEISSSIRDILTDTFGAPELDEIEMTKTVSSTWFWNINPRDKDINPSEVESFNRLDLTCMTDIESEETVAFYMCGFNK